MASQAQKIILSVQGMTCGGCAEAVKRVIRKADPAAEVDVALTTGRVEALTIAMGADLAAAVSRAGYEAIELP
jgi:copper chaperone